MPDELRWRLHRETCWRLEAGYRWIHVNPNADGTFDWGGYTMFDFKHPGVQGSAPDLETAKSQADAAILELPEKPDHTFYYNKESVDQWMTEFYASVFERARSKVLEDRNHA